MTVLKASLSLWVQNYGPQSAPRPLQAAITDERNAEDRLLLNDVDIRETLTQVQLGPLPDIVLTVPFDRFGCPMCGPGGLVVIPGGGGGGTSPEASVGGLVVHILLVPMRH